MRGGGLEPESGGGEESQTASFQGISGGVTVQDATVGALSEGSEDRSETDPRATLVAALTRAITDGGAAGDRELVRVAVGALASLAAGDGA